MTNDEQINLEIESQGLVAHFELKIIQKSNDDAEDKEGYVSLEFTKDGISPISENIEAFSQIEQYEIHGKIAQKVTQDLEPMLEGLDFSL